MAQPEYRKKYLFIDDSSVVQSDNLRRVTNQAVKHPGPVMVPDAPWDTKDVNLNGRNVLYDPQDKLFKMWYRIANRMEGWGATECKTAYATSTDGIHWDRPILNLVEHLGSTANNYILPAELESFCPSVIIDPGAPDSRRFKMIFGCTNLYDSGHVGDWAKHHVSLNLACSDDGIRWHRPSFVNPVLRGISDDVFMFFYDIHRRKYQLYTRRVPNLPRDISLYESFDLVNWEDCGRILVAGDGLDPPTLYNIHGMTVCEYEGYRLGLLNTMHLHPRSEDLGVFQEPPPDYPDRDMIGLMDLQLGYSTDGRTWHRADDRSPVITVGEEGAPDEGMIIPQANSPIVVDGDTYIYYCGWRGRHTAWSYAKALERVDNDVSQTVSGMLAIMPEDHWVSFDAGAEEGVLLAGPWRELPQAMLINANADGGSILVELVDGYERPIPGFSRADCIPITANGKDQPVRWKGDPVPDQAEGDYRGAFMTQFIMKNAKLYSCTLAYPDPDGDRRRYWENLTWNEGLFHSSGQWERDSNTPAAGVPPVARGLQNW
mgnify:CR=1 FL=1|tara:strand:- start:12651 stop:14282 length:1632 start_codon:yes stop_codon:yes gene_type:complete